MIRSRLLFKLGIYDSNFTNASMHHKHHKVQHCNSKKEEQPQQQQSQQPLSPVQSSSQEESQDTVRGSDITITYLVPLKIDQDPQEEQASSPYLISDRPSSSSLSASSSEPSTAAKEPSSRLQKRRSRLIQFDPSATVIPVPSHRSYSPDVHAQIHVPKEELAYNTARNTREFIYEGWDWRNVVEEDGMYVCRSSREHVHPAHVGFAKRRVNPYL